MVEAERLNLEDCHGWWGLPWVLGLKRIGEKAYLQTLVNPMQRVAGLRVNPGHTVES